MLGNTVSPLTRPEKGKMGKATPTSKIKKIAHRNDGTESDVLMARSAKVRPMRPFCA